MPTGPLSPIRYELVGNKSLDDSFDYIRLFMIVLLRLNLRKAAGDGQLYDAIANFADRFDKEAQSWWK